MLIQASNSNSAVQDLSTVIVGVAGVVGTLLAAVIAGWWQARASRDQAARAHESQVAVLRETQQRDERLRERQFLEADHADRLLVTEYIDLLLPRLIQITSIHFLASANTRDEEERQLFERLQHQMERLEVNPAHPERNLGLRLTFLLFQLVGAMRLALNARWTRPLSVSQAEFLSHWEDHLEPVICSGRYPGDELLYREQLEIIADEMLNTQPQAGVKRPMNWKEFCAIYSAGGVLTELSDLIAKKLRFIFDDRNPRTTPLRRSAQCRLAILALYLIRMSEEAGEKGWLKRADAVWRTATNWRKWQLDEGQTPDWFVFEHGDVAARLAAAVPGLGVAAAIAQYPPPKTALPSGH